MQLLFIGLVKEFGVRTYCVERDDQVAVQHIVLAIVEGDDIRVVVVTQELIVHFENLLIVTGENPAKAGVDYLAKALDRAKPYFSNLKIEVMPLSTEDYAMLTHHGLNGVICFQETYNEAHYKDYHPRGMKSKFEWRLNGFDRMGMAGVHSV